MLNSYWAQTDVHDHLPAVLDSLGTPRLASALFGWLADNLRVDEIFVFERPLDFSGSPFPVLSSGSSHCAEERADVYCSHFHRLDPINRRLDGDEAGGQAMRVATDQIPDRHYRAVCYERPNFSEKVSLWRRRSSHWIVASFFRSADVGPLDAKDMDAVGQCGRLLFPLLAKHRFLLSVSGAGAPSRAALIERAERRVSMLSVKLTPRQRVVCSLTAIGMTAHGIALELGIKTSSVVTHRRRAYERLGISGGNELTRLLLT
jgi:DNA-binding CsgD family transcriptional regulator